MLNSTSTIKDKGKLREERLGTPITKQQQQQQQQTEEQLQKARSSAPSPSPSAFNFINNKMNSNLPAPASKNNGSSISSKFGSGKTDSGRVSSSPFKRFEGGNNQESNNTEDSSLSTTNSSQMRVTIISDPNISSAFKQEEDRELFELFLR